MAGWSDGHASVNGVRLHYYRTGGDKPQVVINHGAGDNGLCFTRVVKQLEPDYDVIMPDARGHGKSAGGRGDYSTRARVADLVGLIEALHLDRPVVGGHSMGADTSLSLAAECPDLARAIFLEDPPIILPGEQLGDGTRAFDPAKLGQMMATFMRVFKLLPRFIGLRLARKQNPAYPDDEIVPWIDSKKRVSNDFLRSMSHMQLASLDPFGLFAALRVPTLLIIGDQAKMSIVSQAAAQQAAAVNPLVQVLHLAGASHDIRRTRFDGYMPGLQEFLKAVYNRKTGLS